MMAEARPHRPANIGSSLRLKIAWQFFLLAFLQCRDGYGRAGYEKPFHRKRKASMALSFHMVQRDGRDWTFDISPDDLSTAPVVLFKLFLS